MIRSNGGVRLLSSLLNRDACKSIYEGVFNRTSNSGLWTLSRVIGGDAVRQGHGVNLNNRVLPGSSIRGSASLSRDSNYAAFEDWSPNFPFNGIVPSVPPEDCINCSPKFGKHGEIYEEIYKEIMRQGHGVPHSEKVYSKFFSVVEYLCDDCCRRVVQVVG